MTLWSKTDWSSDRSLVVNDIEGESHAQDVPEIQLPVKDVTIFKQRNGTMISMSIPLLVSKY
jgi:hypothetical protein